MTSDLLRGSRDAKRHTNCHSAVRYGLDGDYMRSSPSGSVDGKKKYASGKEHAQHQKACNVMDGPTKAIYSNRTKYD